MWTILAKQKYTSHQLNNCFNITLTHRLTRKQLSTDHDDDDNANDNVVLQLMSWCYYGCYCCCCWQSLVNQPLLQVTSTTKAEFANIQQEMFKDCWSKREADDKWTTNIRRYYCITFFGWQYFPINLRIFAQYCMINEHAENKSMYMIINKANYSRIIMLSTKTITTDQSKLSIS